MGDVSDSYDLDRFVQAQDGGVYERALAELRAGRKTGHWMWFVFPQLAGLGHSPTAQHYAIVSLDEVRRDEQRVFGPAAPPAGIEMNEAAQMESLGQFECLYPSIALPQLLQSLIRPSDGAAIESCRPACRTCSSSASGAWKRATSSSSIPRT